MPLNGVGCFVISKSAGWAIQATTELDCYGFFAFFSALAAFFCACVFFGFFCSFPFIALLSESAGWASPGCLLSLLRLGGFRLHTLSLYLLFLQASLCAEPGWSAVAFHVTLQAPAGLCLRLSCPLDGESKLDIPRCRCEA